MRPNVVILLAIIGITYATDYQCWNFKQTDTVRQQFLNTINKKRAEIAQGTATNKNGTCPPGQNVYRLNWDCELELKAQAVADQCNVNATAPTGYSQVVRKVAATCNPTPLLKKSIDVWWDTVKKDGVENPPLFNKDSLKDFATLANGRATRIGCAQRNCNEQLYVACVVYEQAPARDSAIYEVGSGCSSAAQCTTFENSKCNGNQKLCVAGHPYTTSTTTSTSATTTAATTTVRTTSAAAATTTTVTTTIAANDNTMCPNNQIITDTVRRTFMNYHNQQRSLLANGHTSMGQGIARRASKMRSLGYDCNAEISARDAAARCMTTASSPASYDENLHVISNTNVDHNSAANTAVAAWWREISTGRMDQVNARNLYSAGLGIPNFANMAWDTHAKLGCAVVRCTSATNVVCHYTPKAKGDGNQIYKMGPPCARCKDYPGASCSSGLCVAP